VTFTHNFYWFNGSIASNKNETELLQADYTEADYRDIGANLYTVYAQNRETGCISLPITTEVKDITVIPQLIFETTASYCEDVPFDLGGGRGNGTIALTLDPADVISDQIVWVEEKTGHDAGTGNYVTGLFPGWYSVDVTTTKGCANTGRAEIPTDIRNYNLVTRNNDGKNDIWVIDCISRFPLNNVKIFNRSGVLVYEADGYDNESEVFQGIGKRGLYMTGNELPVGTYFYIIDKRDGSKPRTGYLELVK
jgi:gliding motility-associated-like protein